jgi:hypothetical protein
MECGEVAEVLHGGELVVEHGGVAHVGDAMALLVGCAIEDGGLAACGSNEAGDDAEEGGFAGTILAKDDGGGARGEGDGEVAQRGEGGVELGDESSGTAAAVASVRIGAAVDIR